MLDQKSVAHFKAAIGKVGKFFVVGDNHKCLTVFGTQAANEQVQILRRRGIQIAGRFVGKDDIRLVDQRAGNGYALLFAAAEFAGFVLYAMGKSQKIKQFGSAFFYVIFGSFLNKTRDSHVFQSRKFGQKMVKLKHKTDVPVAKSRQLARPKCPENCLIDRHRPFICII